MKLARTRGFTLLETMIALAIFAVMISVAGLISHYTYSTFSEVDRGLSENSAAGARFLDTAVNRIMRAKGTQIEDDGRTLIVTAHDGTESKFTLENGALVYYPDRGTTAEKQVLAEGVKDIAFDHDYKNQRTWVEGNPEPDGIWAPIYFYSSEGEPRVAIDVDFGDLKMRTAAVPRLASKTQKQVQWLSPLVNGVLQGVKTVNKDKYAMVAAQTVGMHTPAGLQQADGTIVYVRVASLAAQELKDKKGQAVAFMGDVVREVLPGQLTMAMNVYYGGGMLIGAERINPALEAIAAGEEKWYEAESARIAPFLNEARLQGVDVDDWQQLWRFLETRAR